MKHKGVVFSSLFAIPTRNGVYKGTNAHGEGCKIVNMGELFAYDVIVNQDMKRITMSEDELLKDGLCKNDLLFARRSLVEEGAGKVSIIGDITEPMTFESSIIRVRLDDSKCIPLFYYYWLKSPIGRGAISALVTGTNVKGIRASALKDIIVDYPPIIVQQQTAKVLKEYDDLIENNRKQIKLLEEAAQRLYKEWFVDLRFPGHEDVQIVDGVPEGWYKTTIENKCTLKKAIIHPEETQTGTAYIGLEHIPRHDFCLSNWGDASEVSSNKYIYRQKDIIFGQIRPYFHKVGFAINDGVASTDSFIMEADERCWGLFLLTVSSDAFVQFAYQTCKEGAKMPRADWRQMKKYPLLIPDTSVLCRFEAIVAEITDKVQTIVLQNRYLAEARDRLLPKLMSGEIEL